MAALKKILVTGSNGQLGNELRQLENNFPQCQFLFYDRASWPIQDAAVSAAIIEKEKADFLVNAAAYTAVDKAEQEVDLANEINGHAVGRLAALCNQSGTRFLHVSTDYVFNGSATRPLMESDMVSPLNAYGASKLLGEELTAENNADAVILRTSWVYSSFGNNFVKTMLRLMKEREAINVVADQVGSPTYAADLAEAILHIIGSNWQAGIYNYSNEGVISWFEFACAIRDLAGLSCAVHPIATSQYPTPAKRPAYSVLDKSKIRYIYGLELKPWLVSLQHCLQKLQALKAG